MDKLNIDSQNLSPYAIDAFSHVYGEEYRSIISSKINKSLIISYHDFEGLDDYVSYLKRCKSREFGIKFLDEIGIDVQKHKKNNYTEPLDSDIEDMLEYYIGSTYFGFSKRADYWAPIRAFKSNNNTEPSRLLENKLKIINYLLDNKNEQITKENFNAFTETKEYSKLFKRIEQFNLVYEKLLSEYNDWAMQLQPYEKYIEYEKKRKESILQKKKDEMFEDIFSKLPSFLKENIASKTLKEQQDAILGSSDISSTSIIESFRHGQMEKLKSNDIKLWDKYMIVFWQSNYLKNLGIAIPNEKILKCDSEEDVTNYLYFLNQDSIRKYIPSEELISYISSIRERKYEEALREYYTTRQDFTDILKMFGNNPNNLETIYNNIKNKNVCILGHGATNGNNEFISIMFFTIRTHDGGDLAFNFIHENGHVIDQSQKGVGFESYDDLTDENYRKNPYDENFRKYEKFNETLNDIFTMEAIKFLQNQGIYLIESKEFTALETSNCNTALITKKLLYPLIQKFRQQVIKAKVNAEPKELVKYIGKDNFENLVDVVNKVDYLARNGVASKIDKSPKDSIVLEYFEQVERVKQIYISIDDFYANNFGTFTLDVYENSVKRR